MKTIIERIREAVDHFDVDADSIDNLIACAYYIGREEATREVSDNYTKLIRQQRERASQCRYHKMANDVIGPDDYIYHSDYGMNVLEQFGSNETSL